MKTNLLTIKRKMHTFIHILGLRSSLTHGDEISFKEISNSIHSECERCDDASHKSYKVRICEFVISRSVLADPLQHLSASVDVHWSSHGLHGLCLSLLCIPRMFRVYWSVHGKIIQPFFPLFPPPVPFSLLVKCECCVCTTHEYVSDEKIVRFFSCCMLNPSLSLLLVSFTREKESVKHRTRIMVSSCRVNPFFSPVQKSI